MRIRIRNDKLQSVIFFMDGLELKPASSRARTIFLSLLRPYVDIFLEADKQLVESYAVKDDKGNVIFRDNGVFDLIPETAREFHEERKRLYLEIAEIEGGTYTTHLETLKQILDELDIPLSGEKADAYDILCDAVDESIKEV